MIRQPSEETLKMLAKLAKAAGGDGFHLAPVYVCDHCKDDTKEAFPYGVYDRDGKLWSDLCNGCFTELGCEYPEDDDWDDKKTCVCIYCFYRNYTIRI